MKAIVPSVSRRLAPRKKPTPPKTSRQMWSRGIAYRIVTGRSSPAPLVSALSITRRLGRDNTR